MDRNAKDALIIQLEERVDEIRETIKLLEAWNNSRLDQDPIDVGNKKATLHYTTKKLEALRANDDDAASQWNEQMMESLEAGLTTAR